MVFDEIAQKRWVFAVGCDPADHIVDVVCGTADFFEGVEELVIAGYY